MLMQTLLAIKWTEIKLFSFDIIKHFKKWDSSSPVSSFFFFSLLRVRMWTLPPTLEVPLLSRSSL